MMSRRLWLVVVFCALVSFAAGWTVAQEGRFFPYLPAEYSERYTPTLAEWRALDLTAHLNSEAHLTDQLLRAGLTAHALPDALLLIVDTQTQPTWDVHRGDRRFDCTDRELRAAYLEAAGDTMELVRIFHFPEIADEDVKIEFFIRGASIATWQGGKITLVGERADEEAD